MDYKEFGDKELAKLLKVANRHNPATGFYVDCSAVVAIGQEMIRRKMVKDFLASEGKKTDFCFYFVQEGGSSSELYLHGHDTQRSANAHRRSCEKAAYRTSPVVAVPRELADTAGFHDAVDALLKASLRVDYPGDSK